MRYDHGRENLEQNAVNFLDDGEEYVKVPINSGRRWTGGPGA